MSVTTAVQTIKSFKTIYRAKVYVDGVKRWTCDYTKRELADAAAQLVGDRLKGAGT